MGLALPKKLQNDRSTAHEPVHMAIKAGFGRSIGLKHISPADGYSRQPMQHYISSSGAFQNVFLWLSRKFDLCQTSMLKSLYQPQSRAIFRAIGGALCNIFLHCEEYTVSVLFVVPPFVCWNAQNRSNNSRQKGLLVWSIPNMVSNEHTHTQEDCARYSIVHVNRWTLLYKLSFSNIILLIISNAIQQLWWANNWALSAAKSSAFNFIVLRHSVEALDRNQIKCTVYSHFNSLIFLRDRIRTESITTKMNSILVLLSNNRIE